MLQLINYDLPDHQYPALQRAVENAGGGIHLLNGPWVYGADKSPQEVLVNVDDELRKAAEEEATEEAAQQALENYTKDKLFVFPVKMGEIGTGRNLAQRPIETRLDSKVFAVAYVLRNPSDEHRAAIIRALNELGETCHPLVSLWVVKTDRSAHEVHLALEKAVPLNPKDELIVAEVDLAALMNGHPVKGAEKGLIPEHRKWLVETGVL